MTGEVVDKITTEIDFRLAPGAQRTIDLVNNFREGVGKKAKNLIGKTFLNEDIFRDYGKKAAKNARNPFPKISNPAAEFREDVRRTTRKLMAAEEKEFLASEKRLRFEGAFKPETLADIKHMEKLFEGTNPKNIQSMRMTLAEHGFDSGYMNDSDVFKTHFGWKRDRKADRAEKERLRLEQQKTRGVLAEERKRTQLLTKGMRTLGIVSRGFLAVSLARGIFGLGRAAVNNIAKIGRTASDLKTTAMLTGTTPQDVYAVEQWFSKHGVDPKAGVKTLEGYAKFDNLKNLPLPQLLERLIGELKTGDPKSAAIHGGDPNAILKMKEYKGDLRKELADLRAGAPTKERLELLDTGWREAYKLKENFIWLGREFFVSLIPVLKGLNKTIDFLRGAGEPGPELSDEENYAEHIKANPQKFTSPAAAAKTVTVNNVFNIQSRDPEAVAREVEFSLTKSFFSDITDGELKGYGAK
jgi:hypothetical protein